MIDDTYHLALWKREVMNQSVSEMLYEMEAREASMEYVESMRIPEDEWQGYFEED